MSDAAVNSEDVSLVSQCLAICQVLANQGKHFSFMLKVGSNLIFNLDTKMKPLSVKKRKKLSPSIKRRKARRRDQFLASKENSTQVNSKSKEAQDIPATDDKLDEIVWVSCDQCGHKIKTENGMKLNKKRKHEISQVDANDTLTDSISENEDEHKEMPSNQNAPNANDVLMALNTLGSSLKEVNEQINNFIIK